MVVYANLMTDVLISRAIRLHRVWKSYLVLFQKLNDGVRTLIASRRARFGLSFIARSSGFTNFLETWFFACTFCSFGFLITTCGNLRLLQTFDADSADSRRSFWMSYQWITWRAGPALREAACWSVMRRRIFSVSQAPSPGQLTLYIRRKW